MSDLARLDFDEIYVLDFEFVADEGEIVRPVCMVAKELKSGQTIRIFEEELSKRPPFRVSDNVLFVAYYAPAEISCFLALGWPVPRKILDLYAEFCCATNGLNPTNGRSLIGALAYHGLDSVSVAEKEMYRALIMGGGPWSAPEQQAILTYCEGDVVLTESLLYAMLPQLDEPRALLRGRYMAAVARMQHNGIPLDRPMLDKIDRHGERVKDELINEIDREYGIYDGRVFKADRFAAYLERQNIPWPHDERGRLKLDDLTFREMERGHAEIAPLRALRSYLSGARANRLEIGRDGRNRSSLSPFRAKTSRNQPSTNRFVFGLHACWRSLIRPPEGTALVYIDYCQQEFGIGAAQSGDPAMIEAYQTGDPYLAFAKQARLAPPEATKQSHKPQRDRAKACVLAVQYGMGEESLATRLNCPVVEARHLLSLHRQAYKRFWAWSNGNVDFASLRGVIWTVFGWMLRNETNPRALANFPMQANGAEMLRLACIMGTESGVQICAPVHDAVLIQTTLEDLDSCTSLMREFMAEASRQVLDGFTLRTDADVTAYPDHFVDPRGTKMWSKLCALIERAERGDLLADEHPLDRQVLAGDTGSSIIL